MIIRGKVRKIEIDFTWINKRDFTKIIRENNNNNKLIIKKIPISTKSIENAPCLTCEVEAKCSLDGEISPKTCQLIEDWVLVELKNK